MTTNNPDSHNRLFASRENGVIKTERQLLIEAEKKIGEMEKERRLGIEHIERMKWQNAQLRMAVAALATKHGHTPDDVKAIYEAYVAAEESKAQDEATKLNEEMKAKFKADIAAGKLPEGFKVISRDDVPPAMP